MANFSNAKANLVGTTPVTLVDADVATVISGCSVANRHGSTTSVSLYVENSLELADQYWVEHNRKVVLLQEQSTASNDEEIIETNGHDYALHAIES